MGFFDSLLKSTVKKVANEMINEAKDIIFNDDNKPSSTATTTTSASNADNTAPQFMGTTEINRPDISGEIHKEELYSISKDGEVEVSFEMSVNFFLSDCGAAEIPIYLVMSDYGNDVFDDSIYDSMPAIAIGQDELPNGRFRGATNVLEYDVVGHSLIEKKYVYKFRSEKFRDIPERNYHCIMYKFYFDEAEKQQGNYTMLLLRVPTHCGQDTREYAEKALDLIAYTLKIGN